MSIYRQIHTRMWSDAWFLDLLPEEKLLFVYLFSNEHASMCGLYELPLKTMAFETGLRTDAITLTLHRFGEAGKVLYEPPYIWVPNLRKYNENRSPKVAAMIQAQIMDVPDCELKRRYLAGNMTPLDVAPASPLTEEAGHNYTVSEKKEESRHNSNSNSNKNSNKNKEPLAPKNGRPPDDLFNAIATVCQVDPVTTGASIGKVRVVLLRAAYTPAEVEAFGKWWWGDKGMRQRPPTVWQLQEQIGVVRQAKQKIAAPAHPMCPRCYQVGGHAEDCDA